MFHLLRFIIWLAGVLVVVHFVLGYFGYEINYHYFDQNKSQCQEELKSCQRNLIRQGLDNAKCDFQCIDPKLIIKKKEEN
jgi:uncharacterized membrane protein